MHWRMRPARLVEAHDGRRHDERSRGAVLGTNGSRLEATGTTTTASATGVGAPDLPDQLSNRPPETAPTCSNAEVSAGDEAPARDGAGRPLVRFGDPRRVHLERRRTSPAMAEPPYNGSKIYPGREQLGGVVVPELL